MNELTAVLRALAAWLTGMSETLSSGKEAPSLQDLTTALERFRGAVGGAGPEWFASATEKEDIQRVFALLFVFDQMLQNLQDLADRARELRESEF